MNDVSLSIPEAQERNRSSLTARLLPRALELHPLVEYYRGLPQAGSPADFARQALAGLDISVEMDGKPLDSLPVQGPLVLAANHPFGGVEGLVLAAWCARQRPDLKILVNHMLCHIPELRSLFIPVNVLRENGGAGNIAGVRAALAHLKEGGALAVFPSGVVSHWHARQRRVTDPEWHPLVGRLGRVAGASVVPLYFEGRNSLLFQAMGCVHPILRTMLLPQELWRMRRGKVRLRIGERVEPELLAALQDDTARAAYIRARCYALGGTQPRRKTKRMAAIAAERSREALRDEISSLPPERILAEEGKFQTLCVNGKEAPHILREIGRLREKSFRAVKEGSGKALDIDRFDPHYTHLVLWDKEARAIAGGYRARCVFPATLPGKKTLYTASLFHFKAAFFEHCGTAMELGRAFVAQEYQRDYAPLLMLWKGIGRFAAMTGARTLFGPSSIGLGYAPESVFMLRQHLKECYSAPHLAGLAQGRRSPRPFRGPNAPDARGLEYKALDRAVKGIEGDKGLPILFKHYLQLGGRIAAFHEDRKFGTLDALMIVDLAQAPEKLLLRYMGAEGLRMLRMAHRTQQQRSFAPDLLSPGAEADPPYPPCPAAA